MLKFLWFDYFSGENKPQRTGPYDTFYINHKESKSWNSIEVLKMITKRALRKEFFFCFQQKPNVIESNFNTKITTNVSFRVCSNADTQ